MPRSAALLVLVLAGCLEPREVIILMDERFEDGLASWTVTGDAEIVPTIHPGEHALFFYQPTRMERPISVVVWDEFQDGNWIEYTSNCGETPAVRLDRRADLSWQIILELPLLYDEEPDQHERVFVSVPPIQREEYSSASYSLLTVIAPSGGCYVDNLRLMQPQPDSGF